MHRLSSDKRELHKGRETGRGTNELFRIYDPIRNYNLEYGLGCIEHLIQALSRQESMRQLTSKPETTWPTTFSNSSNILNSLLQQADVESRVLIQAELEQDTWLEAMRSVSRQWAQRTLP